MDVKRIICKRTSRKDPVNETENGGGRKENALDTDGKSITVLGQSTKVLS